MMDMLKVALMASLMLGVEPSESGAWSHLSGPTEQRLAQHVHEQLAPITVLSCSCPVAVVYSYIGGRPRAQRGRRKSHSSVHSVSVQVEW